MNTLPQDFTIGFDSLGNPWVQAAMAVAIDGVVLLWYVLSKGRQMPGAHVFRASRLSKGPSRVTHYTPQWIGKLAVSVLPEDRVSPPCVS